MAGVLSSSRDSVVYIEKVDSQNPMSCSVPVGSHRELYCTALGKLALAFSNPEIRERCLSHIDFEAATDTTIVSRFDLEAALECIRSTGIATALDERIRGASGIAAPILTPDGQLVAGIALIGPSARVARCIEAYTAKVIDEARALTHLVAAAPSTFITPQ